MSNAAIKRNSLFYWDAITLKIEDELFRVPKNDFTEYSEVFADMFVMPPGNNQGSEGEDDEHPIVLEGYKKNDFMSLLKVMYPSSRTLLSSMNTVMKLDLSRDEWISVLNLSTRWIMKEVRAYAIHQLSTAFTISPTDKILLARAHHVAKWLEEGVTALAESKPKGIKELSVLNSWETTARILSIAMTHVSTPNPPLDFRLEQLKCNSCTKIAFGELTCHPCRTSFATSSMLRLSSVSIGSDGTHKGYINQLKCGSCCSYPWPNGGTANCKGCNRSVNFSQSHYESMFVDFGKGASLKEMVDEHFGDEAKEYRITWPDS